MKSCHLDMLSDPRCADPKWIASFRVGTMKNHIEVAAFHTYNIQDFKSSSK